MFRRRWNWWPFTEKAEPEGDRWQKLLAEGQWQAAADMILQTKQGRDADHIQKMRADELLQAFLSRGWSSLATDSALSWLREVDQLNVRGFHSAAIEQFRGVADLVWEAGRAANRNDHTKAISLLEQAMKACPNVSPRLKNQWNESLVKLNERPIVGTAIELPSQNIQTDLNDIKHSISSEFLIVTQSAGDYVVTTRDRFLFSHELFLKNKTSVNEAYAFLIEMTRDEEGCWLMGAKAGELICKGNRQLRLALMDGAEVALGGGIVAAFFQPVMESGTARMIFRNDAGEVLQQVLMLGQMGRVGGPGRPDLPLAGADAGLILIRQNGRLMARPVTAAGGLKEEFPVEIPCDLSVGDEKISMKLDETFDASVKFFGQ